MDMDSALRLRQRNTLRAFFHSLETETRDDPWYLARLLSGLSLLSSVSFALCPWQQVFVEKPFVSYFCCFVRLCTRRQFFGQAVTEQSRVRSALLYAKGSGSQATWISTLVSNTWKQIDKVANRKPRSNFRRCSFSSLEHKTEEEHPPL